MLSCASVCVFPSPTLPVCRDNAWSLEFKFRGIGGESGHRNIADPPIGTLPNSTSHKQIVPGYHGQMEKKPAQHTYCI